MTEVEFLAELQDILQRDEDLETAMALRDLPEWDSLSMMAVAAMFDKHFARVLNFADFESLVTVGDLMGKAGLES